MLKKVLLGTLAGVGLLFGATAAVAQMPMESPPQTTQFRRIDQPIGLKIAVTAGGLALIGLELWWFLYSKNRVQKADTTNQGIQEVTITVDGGYEPSQVVVNAGQPVRLNFDRRDPSSCLEQVRLPDFGIAQDLKLDQVTPIEFIPQVPGQYLFTCGMNMFRGTVEVQPADTSLSIPAESAQAESLASRSTIGSQ